MSKLAKALTAAAGNAGESLYVEDVFSTYLYTGNSSTQTITNGIDLDGEGGLVWIKGRSGSHGAENHVWTDTVRGYDKNLYSNLNSGQTTSTNRVTTFNNNGFSLGSEKSVNNSATTYASWTFRKAEKFFDVLTYTGDGATKTINHNLGVAPACIIIKKVDSVLYDAGWVVYHQSLTNPDTYYLALNTTAGQTNYGANFISNVTSTTFDIAGASGFLGVNGSEYVAYLFAHDAGGFGADGSESIIKCGSYTGTGAAGNAITLGYEPQWLLIKRADSTSDWAMFNNMMGMTLTDDTYLWANLGSIENTYNVLAPTATGFIFQDPYLNASGGTYIYIAIRRPMKTPESGTEVFNAYTRSGGTTGINSSAGHTVDLLISKHYSAAYNWWLSDRLRGSAFLKPNGTDTEFTGAPIKFDAQTGINLQTDTAYHFNESGDNLIDYTFKRATGFFDVVCFTAPTSGTFSTSHNLSVAPELVIIKRRSGAEFWITLFTAGSGSLLALNETIAANFSPPETYFTQNGSTYSAPNATSLFLNTISSGSTNVAYLFATCPGVSKVGSYTGTAADLNIDCGFSAGARFILIKRTDSTGDWYVWDSARGIVAGNDPYLLLNSSAAEVTSTDYIDPLSSGFTVTSSAPAALNASGGTYIFLAIA